MARKKREIKVKVKTNPKFITPCAECGKRFERFGADWGYVSETGSDIFSYYCSYRCMRANERKKLDAARAILAMAQ